jgi:hypothetical protein
MNGAEVRSREAPSFTEFGDQLSTADKRPAGSLNCPCTVYTVLAVRRLAANPNFAPAMEPRTLGGLKLQRTNSELGRFSILRHEPAISFRSCRLFV